MKQSNYPVGDFLIRIKNAAKIRQKKLTAGNSKLIQSVAELLVELGYLEDVAVKDDKITVSIAYHRKKSILYDLKLVSKPGLRIYKSADEIEATKGPFILLLSTNKGVMSSEQALKERVGGEVIARIW